MPARSPQLQYMISDVRVCGVFGGFGVFGSDSRVLDAGCSDLTPATESQTTAAKSQGVAASAEVAIAGAGCRVPRASL